MGEKTTCSVCGGDRLDEVLDLPNLPLTGVFVRENEPGYRGIDQALNICAGCGHAQLQYALEPSLVYDRTYTHRGSLSPISTGGNDFFAAFLERVTEGRVFKRIAEVGCNDLYLSRKIAHKGEVIFGIDPIWKEAPPPSEGNINVIGAFVEEVDFDSQLGGSPDLVLSVHTFEHIDEPREQLQRLVDVAEDGAMFVVEIPSFATLLRTCRYDQVFHQHINYFSLASFRQMIRRLGGSYVAHTHNYGYWGGTLLVAFRKGGTGRSEEGSWPEAPTLAVARDRLGIFRQQLGQLMAYLEKVKPAPIHGYGAAQMLPVLAYHMGTDLSFLEDVLDDDPNRDGLAYPDLRVRIRKPDAGLDLTDATVLITALDSVRPIMRRLLGMNPRQILVPLQMF